MHIDFKISNTAPLILENSESLHREDNEANDGTFDTIDVDESLHGVYDHNLVSFTIY